MILSSLLGAAWASGARVLWDHDGILLCRACREGPGGKQQPVLALVPATEHPTAQSLDRMAHEYGLKDELDAAWAAKPLELVRGPDRTLLILEDPGGEPLEHLLGRPMQLESFLRLAAAIARAVGKVHLRGLVHKDINPGNILVHRATGEVRLTGFGMASCLPRERASPEPPEHIAGTLAYMAPEQTGRMNRAVDSRSDLYSLGVTFYRLLTGAHPFGAGDPMEWVHCHIARQPVPMSERAQNAPAAVCAIIMKLLAKTPEDRYQTAAGVEHDLRRCLAEWDAHRRIDAFPPGERDTPDRLSIPEKLYGRAREVDALLASFDRVVAGGGPELVLVAGGSGIGKSSVVNELHKVLVPPRGLFASGKFDQHKRDIPYATLAQAFQKLLRPLLGSSDTELAPWRHTLLEALGGNGQLVIDLVPELALLIGEQPRVPELPAQEARDRLHLALRRFIGVFARQEHPLALFLDDLQWLDPATLDLLADLLTRPDLPHLMLIGAYRDNEVDAAHPLRRKLQAIRTTGARVEELTLAPLAGEHVEALIADALRCEPQRAAPLARLVRGKTAGNPFFTIQFLYALAERGLLLLDHDAAQWSWDLGRIQAEGATDNVLDLMGAKLTRLPAATQAGLRQLACLGNSADVDTLSTVLGCAPQQVHATLWEAVRLELVDRQARAYRFVHDRVQEAAYSQIPDASRPEAHLRIGRLLAARTPPERREEAAFEILNQLNRGIALVTSPDERQAVAELNLMAGKRAKAAAAHGSALTYFIAGASLLGSNRWQSQYQLAFELELHRAECEFVTGELVAAEEHLAALSTRAATIVEQAAVACLRMDLYVPTGRSERAVAVGLEFLRLAGIDWPAHPTQQEARQEYERVLSRLASRTTDELIALPLLSDPHILATLDVLTKLGPPASFTDGNLSILTNCRAVNLNLELGHSDAACQLYAWVGMIAGTRFGDYGAGFRLGQLGYELAQRRGSKRFLARTYLVFGASILPWVRPAKAARETLRHALEAAVQCGDIAFAQYSYSNLTSNLLAAGDRLDDVQRELENALAFVQKVPFECMVEIVTTKLAFVRMLRGLTPRFGCLDHAQFDEHEIERTFADAPEATPAADCWYWIRKLQARFLAGDYESALDASARAERWLWVVASAVETADYHLYSALSHTVPWAPPADRQPVLEGAAPHYRQLKTWAETCRENFAHRAALVGAEIARVEGRELEAEHMYEQAARSARANGFTQDEALAIELAARFHAARGFERIAHVYLRDARYLYLRWGAQGKVGQLERLYPRLLTDDSDGAATSAAAIAQMDVATVVKALQAVSSEIVLPRLIETLMTIALQSAGADRGLLIRRRRDDLWIEAEARLGGDATTVVTRPAPVSAADCPETLLRYVIRTQKALLLDDASRPDPRCDADYVQRRRPRSILCLPMMKQGELTGLLYFENTLATHAFTPDRVAVLELLAAQAAISLENTLLYSDLQQAEEKYRLLMEQAHDAILALDRTGVIIEANRAAEAMLGRPRDTLIGRTFQSVAGCAGAPDLDAALTSPAGLTQLRLPGPDGKGLDAEMSETRVSTGAQELILVIARDITQRQRLEQQLRQSQKMDAIGQLTGGVAHDFNNVLTVIAGTVDMLIEDLSDRPELVPVVGMIQDAATRGTDLTKQLLAFARKQPLQPRSTDINGLIVEAARLLRPALGEHVEIDSTLDPECRRALVDPSQLSTALINLAVNARDAMPAGGRITFGTRNVNFGPQVSGASAEINPGDYVMITVRDTGVGIPAAIRDKIFEPFFTTKAPGKGTGLGLSMVYGFVKQSGGHIRIDSDEGQGTTVSLYLPCATQEAAAAGGAAPQTPQRGSETILVVEDDALVRNYVVAQLNSLGYATIAAANGPEALALVDQGAVFDVLLTDVIMPGGMNGRDLADAVTRRRPGVPVLYTSGYPESAIVHQGRLDPGVALLSKPYRKADLASLMRQVLASRDARAASG
jgi:PAS domain S-box-containing protein